METITEQASPILRNMCGHWAAVTRRTLFATTMHSVTDRRTDGQQDDANSRGAQRGAYF